MSEVTAEMIERGRGGDPQALAERRKRAFEVREAREKLTSGGSGHRAFEAELLRVYAQSRQNAALPATLTILSVTAMATFWVDIGMVIIWMTLACAATLLGFGLARRYLDADLTAINIGRWRKKFFLAELNQGLTWGGLVVLLYDAGASDARAFMLVVLMLVGTMGAMTTATLPSAAYAAVGPIIAAVIFVSLRSLTDPASIPLTAFAVGALLYFITLARRLYDTSLGTLYFEAEKDGLIAELEQSKANSDEARRRAEEANLAKSRFLATMSHELRTPLNAILGFSEVMKGELFGAHIVPAYKEYSADIHSSGQHLLMLINEILDLSRVEAGRYELKEDAVSLSGIIEDCRHLLTLRAKKRDIIISEAIEPQLPRIWADERAVRQVALNLLTNALKFTPQGGTVTIKVGWTGSGGQYFSIRDTGPGIPEAEIPVVMSSFGRGTLAQKNADEGSGLGLPIVKGLVELHGGSFTLKSKVREGTEVIVVFPPQRVMDVLPRLDPNPQSAGFEIISDRPAA